MIDFSPFTKEGAAVFVTDAATRRYLTGLSSSDGFVLVLPDGIELIVDSRYYEMAAAGHSKRCQAVLWKDSIEQTVAERLSAHHVSRLYVSQTIGIGFYRSLCEKMPCEVVTDAALEQAMARGRSIKTEEEIEKITKAQRIAERAYLNLLSVLRPGLTERQVALQLDYEMRTLGSEGVSFDTIAVCGTRSSMPHGQPTDEPLRDGDFLTLDFGAVYEGYHSDTTRTVAIGHATDAMCQVYDVVLKAQECGCRALADGVPCAEADAACRTVIREAGYGECFGHATGHGVGLEIHEYPSVSPRSGERLRTNQVVTVEPGIYLPGRFGVRIEDLLVVRAFSSENLTKLSKGLIIL